MTPPLVPTDRPGRRVPASAVVLMVANLVPLGGVFFLGWSVFAILLLFWLENVIVGGFNVLRILCAQPDNPVIWVTKVFLIPFFTFHYGMFVTVHGIFVLALFGDGSLPTRGFPSPATFLHAVQGAGIAPAAWALLLSHGISFAFNYIGAGGFRTAEVAALMTRPYGRVMVLHVVIIVGGFLVKALGSPLLPLALLVVLKTGLDLVGHVREHAAPVVVTVPGGRPA